MKVIPGKFEDGLVGRFKRGRDHDSDEELRETSSRKKSRKSEDLSDDEGMFEAPANNKHSKRRLENSDEESGRSKRPKIKVEEFSDEELPADTAKKSGKVPKRSRTEPDNDNSDN